MAKEKSDQEFAEEWNQVAIAKDKVRQSLALLKEVRKSRQADGELVIRLRKLDSIIESLEDQVKLFENPLYEKCFGCGWHSVHIDYPIKGRRSGCCNE